MRRQRLSIKNQQQQQDANAEEYPEKPTKGIEIMREE